MRVAELRHKRQIRPNHPAYGVKGVNGVIDSGSDGGPRETSMVFCEEDQASHRGQRDSEDSLRPYDPYEAEEPIL